MATKTITCPGPPEHTFEHTQAGRGRPPVYCPEHKPTKSPKRQVSDSGNSESSENPFIKKARNREKMDHAREGKVDKAIAREREEQAKLEAEFATIDERVEACYANYDVLFKAALQTNDDKAWAKLDGSQRSCVNASKRKRQLYEYFEDVTSGNRPTIAPTPITVAPAAPAAGMLDPDIQDQAAEDLEAAIELMDDDLSVVEDFGSIIDENLG
jgi:hypothetical protein